MAAKTGRKKSQEELLAGFNALRTEQRQIANKIYEIENEYTEHKIVIEALKETDAERKCFRMIGGILVEGTVKEVLPNLVTNSEKMKELMDSMNNKLIEKGKEILEYKEKHPGSFVTGGGLPAKIPEEPEPAEENTKTTGLLAS